MPKDDDDLAQAFAAPGVALAARLRAIGGELDQNRSDSETVREWLAGIGRELVNQREGFQTQADALAELRAGQEGQQADAANQWQVLAGVNLSIARIGKILDSYNRREQKAERRRMADHPIYTDFAQSKAFPSTGALVLDCGGPSMGRIWHVKRLVVGGLTLNTTANGTAEAYASGYIPDQGGTTGVASSLSDLHDATILISSPQTNLPNIGNYDDGQFVVLPQERVLVVIRSGTVGQVYVAAGTAKDIRVQPHDSVESEG